jgi:DNA ligase-1
MRTKANDARLRPPARPSGLHAARNAKLTLLRDYLRERPIRTRLGRWQPDRRAVLRRGQARHDPQGDRSAHGPALFALSYDYVGDLAETVALVWPASPAPTASPNCPKSWMRCAPARREVPQLLERWLDALDADGRWALLKLADRRLARGRVGAAGQAGAGRTRRCASRRDRRSLARPAPPYEDLFAWLEKRSEKPSADTPGRFRPVMLAQAIDEVTDFAKLDANDYAAEWKWDGIRVQAGERRRAAPALQPHRRRYRQIPFPMCWSADFDGVIDGELLVMRDGMPWRPSAICSSG